jgi:hypothetical protein
MLLEIPALPQQFPSLIHTLDSCPSADLYQRVKMIDLYANICNEK